MKRLAAIVLLILLVVAACGSSAEEADGGASEPTATRQAAALLTPTEAFRPVLFPADEAPHDNMTEWWYYTGHLFDDRGERYGFEYVIFQVQRGSFPAFYASHFAVTDNHLGEFTYSEKSGFDGRIETDTGFHLKLDDWEIQGANGLDTLSASMDRYELDLTLTTDDPPVLHNRGTGYMQIGLAGNSYYYSRPGMEVEGSLTVDGEERPVTGNAWMDHQWGDFVLVNGGGWDWFAIELEDGTALMVFQLRGIEGIGDVEDYGTLVQPDGTVVHLAESDFIIESLDTWRSDVSGAVYPVR